MTEKPALPHPYRRFSLPRLAALAGNTFLELTRLKIFYVVLVFAFLLIGNSIFMARFSFQQEFQILKDISLGAINVFLCLLAIVATARLLPQELEDRTAYTVLAKPVPRLDYLLGKLIGVFLLLAVSALLMSALFFAVLYFREQSLLAQTALQMQGAPEEELRAALAEISASAFHLNLLQGLVVIYFKAALLAALTLFVSTFATTSIFTIVVMTFVYFIGHLQAIAREAWLEQQIPGLVSRLFLALVALIFPDLQLFNVIDDLVAGAVIPAGLFLKTLGLGSFYIVLYLLLAAAAFQGREL